MQYFSGVLLGQGKCEISLRTREEKGEREWCISKFFSGVHSEVGFVDKSGGLTCDRLKVLIDEACDSVQASCDLQGGSVNGCATVAPANVPKI